MLIVFDLDGTLIDSRRDLADAANALIQERRGAPLSMEAVTGMVGEGAALLVRRALTAAGLDPESPNALPRFLELYDERLLAHTRPYEGIPEAVRALAARHDLAVLTNKPTRPSRRILEGLGLLQSFREVVGGDNARGRKPDPGGLLGIVAGTDHSPVDAILVGDSPIDMATARAANVRLCVARYGFGFHAEEMPLARHDLAVDRPEDLLRTLEP
jgi:phosphoglycolate phosphatase